MAVSSVKDFIANLKKPFDEMKLKKTQTAGKYLEIISDIGEAFKLQSTALDKSVKKLKTDKKKIVKALPAPEGEKFEPLIRTPEGEKFEPLARTPVGKNGDEQKSEDDEEKKEDEERTSLLKSLIKSTREGLGELGDKTLEGLQPIGSEAEQFNESMQDALLGPFAGIAKSTQAAAFNAFKQLKQFTQERFMRVKEWFKERREAKRQLKAQRKTTEAVEDLHKTTKRQFFFRMLVDQFKPILNMLGNLITALGPKLLLAGLAGAVAAGLKNLIKDLGLFDFKIRIKEFGEFIRDAREIFTVKGIKKAGKGAEEIITDIKNILSGEKGRFRSPAEVLKMIPETFAEFFKKYIAETEKKKEEKDVLDVIKGGLVNVTRGDVVVDKESLADVLSGTKGAAIDRITKTGITETRDIGTASLLNEIKNRIATGNEAAIVGSTQIVNSIQNVSMAGAGGGSFNNEDFFDMISKEVDE